MTDSKKIEFLDLISGNFKSPLDDWEQEVFSILKSEERKGSVVLMQRYYSVVHIQQEG